MKMINNCVKKYNWLIVFMMAFFISEAIYKWFYREGFKEIRIAGAVKLIVLTMMLLAIFNKYKQNHRYIFLILLLCFIFYLGQISLPAQYYNIYNFEYLVNSLFIFIMFIFFNSIELSEKQKASALNVYHKIVIINSTAIIIGWLLTIEYFKTYSGLRAGYSGFLVKSSLSSYFYLVALFIYSEKFLFLRSTQNLIYLLIVVFATILTGTKANLLAIFSSSFYFIIKTKAYKNKLFIALAVIACLGTAFFFKSLISLSDSFESIVKKDGVATAVFSFRNQILTQDFLPFVNENWNIKNYLFGGMGDIMIKTGFDIFDLIYFFGLFGAILYLFIFNKLFCTFKRSLLSTFFVFSLIIISSLAGNFFYNSSIAIFIYTLKVFFEKREHENTPS